MPNFVYTSDIPDENDNPSVDQPDMKTNTNSISSILQVDHYGFNDNNGGYHKPIHIVQQTNSSTNPSPVATTNIVYSKPYTPDTTGGTEDIQLYSISAAGKIAQLTGFLTTNTATSDGWAWVGGILLQWGFVSVKTNTSQGDVNFKDRIAGAIPFPNSCFCVVPTLFIEDSFNPALLVTSSIAISAANKTRFRYKFVVPNAVVDPLNGFYWIAIGN